MDTKIDTNDLSFEDGLRELEATISTLESGELALEKSLALYEQGQKLAQFCTEQLEHARLRVEMLSDDGEIVSLTSND